MIIYHTESKVIYSGTRQTTSNDRIEIRDGVTLYVVTTARSAVGSQCRHRGTRSWIGIESRGIVDKSVEAQGALSLIERPSARQRQQHLEKP